MEEKIKALVEGNLEDMRIGITDLNAEELALLKAAEQAKDKPRGGAIEMIDAALVAINGDGDDDDAEEIAAKPSRIVLIVPTDRRDLIARLDQVFADGDIVAIVFADADGELLNVPPIEAKLGDFQRFGGGHPRLIYQPRIELPMAAPAVAVRQIFLLVEPSITDKVPAAVAVCRLTADLHAGGGRKAEIPDGNLLFSLG